MHGRRMAGAWLAHGTSINESGIEGGIREKSKISKNRPFVHGSKPAPRIKDFFSCMAPTAQPSDVH